MQTTWNPVTGPSNDQIEAELETYNQKPVIQLYITEDDGHTASGYITPAQARELAVILNQLADQAGA